MFPQGLRLPTTPRVRTLLNSSTRATRRKANIRGTPKGSTRAVLKAGSPGTSTAGEEATTEGTEATEDTVAGTEAATVTRAAKVAEAAKNTKAKKDTAIEAITGGITGDTTEDTTGGTTRARARAEKDTEATDTEDTGTEDTAIAGGTEDTIEDAKAAKADTKEGTKPMEDMKVMEGIRIGVEAIRMAGKVLACRVCRLKEELCPVDRVDRQRSRSGRFGKKCANGY